MTRFPMERWLEEHDGLGRWDISRSGYHPKLLRDLFAENGVLEEVLDAPQRYTANHGGAHLREIVASLWPGRSSDNVIVTSGTTESNWLAVDALIQPGDEFVSMEPTYQQAPLAAQAHGATIKRLCGREAEGWRPDLSALAELVTDRTRMIYVCQPANPTGVCLTGDELDGIVDIAARAGAWILADEIYRGSEHRTGEWAPSFSGRYDRVVVTGSLSKTFGLPGLRTGWLASETGLVETACATREYINAWQSRPADVVAGLVLEPSRRKAIADGYRRRLIAHLPILLDWVSAHDEHASLVRPEATATGFLHLSLTNAHDSFAVADRLREQAGVLVVPGALFGGDDQGHVRVTYGVEPDQLTGALGAIGEVLARDAVGARAGRGR